MLSAPPMPAPMQLQVARNWLTHGSRRASERDAVIAPSCVSGAEAPHTSRTRCQSLRAARNFAMVWKTSGVCRDRERNLAARLVDIEPVCGHYPQGGNGGPHCDRQVLDLGCTGCMPDIGVEAKRTKTRRATGAPASKLGPALQLLFHRSRQFAVSSERTDRIDTENAGKIGAGDIAPRRHGKQQRGSERSGCAGF